MRIVTLLLTVNIGLSFSRTTTNSCQSTTDGPCRIGQHVILSQEFGLKCIDCPKETFMDLASHSCTSCKEHTKPSSNEIIFMTGDSTVDNVVGCVQGFFRDGSVFPETRGYCQRCTVCGDGMWAARECSAEEDTLCCPNGMVAVLAQESGSLSCAMAESRVLSLKQSVRKERSSGSNDLSTTKTNGDDSGNNVRTDDTSSGRGLVEGTQSSPDHGYSRADYETEQKRNKVDFPIWARILCAGVAIGVFLFYLGVGIPCNLCGSKDKLKALRNRILGHREQEQAEVEGSKEKQDEKVNSAGERV